MTPAHPQERSARAVGPEVGPMRHWVDALCAEHQVSDVKRADIALAVSEALANVVVHAYRDRPEPGTMRMSACFTDHRLAVEVGDEGSGMRPRLDSPGQGMGLPLIAALASEVEVLKGPSGGVVVRMVFALEV